MATLSAALALSDGKSRADALMALLPSFQSGNDAPSVKAAVDAALSDSMSTHLTRQLLKGCAEAADEMTDAGATITVCDYAVEKIRPRLAQLEDCDYAFRFALFRTYSGAEDYLRAATVLSQARLDSSMISDADRAKAYVRCAQNFIRGDDDVSAETFIRRASEVVYRQNDRGLLLQFKAAHAQVLDAKRKFAEAAGRYLDILRSVSEEEIGVEETVFFTEKAAIAAVLAPAGPVRVRLISSLMRMPRIREIKPAVFSCLEKMGRDAFLATSDVSAFEAHLLPHQKATSSDGSTVMQRASLEHNMLACSRVYRNISLSSLAKLLGISGISGGGEEAAKKKAERIAATMIKERRLAASIDQVGGFLDFSPVQPAAGSKASVAASSASASSSSSSSASSSTSSAATGGAGGSAGASGSGAAGASGGGAAMGMGEVERTIGTTFPSAAAANSDSAEGAAQRLLLWDQRIKETCLQVNAAVEAIGSKHPALLPN